MNGIDLWVIVFIAAIDSLAIYAIAWLFYKATLRYSRVSRGRYNDETDHRNIAAAWFHLAVAGLVGMFASLMTWIYFESIHSVWPLVLFAALLVVGMEVSADHERKARRYTDQRMSPH